MLYSREHVRNEMHWALRFLAEPAKRDEVSSADPALPYYGRDSADTGVRGQQQITSRAAASAMHRYLQVFYVAQSHRVKTSVPLWTIPLKYPIFVQMSDKVLSLRKDLPKEG